MKGEGVDGGRGEGGGGGGGGGGADGRSAILLMQMLVGASLSEPYTSVTSLHPCVCMNAFCIMR